MVHRRGVEAVRHVVEAAPDLGIEVLTLYAFSSENWKRPADEVSDLMGLRSEEHTSELQSLMRNSYAVFCLKKQKHDTRSGRCTVDDITEALVDISVLDKSTLECITSRTKLVRSHQRKHITNAT